jgi:outer membrane protein TolC
VWAGLPPNTDWSNPSIKPLEEIAEPEDKLVEIAVAKRPAFRQLELALKMAEDGADLARRELSPDYAVKFSYGQRDNGPMRRSDVVSAEVMFDIPLYHKTKQDRMISQSLLEADKMRLDIEAERLKLRRDIAELMEVQRKNEKLVDLYNTRLLPQAQQSVDAALSAYRVNKVDFRWLVMNQITLFNYQLQKFQIEYDLQTMRARLLRALGGNNSEVENGY